MTKAILMMMVLASLCAPVWAEETTPTVPTTKASPDSPPVTGPGNPPSESPASTSASVNTPPSANTPPAANTPNAPSATNIPAPAPTSDPGAAPGTSLTGAVKSNSTLIPSEPAPGPYEADRKKVRNWLMVAKQRGVGLAAYMPVWNDMENSVRAGASEKDVKAKLDGICRSIGNQVRDSSQIQRFRPVKPKPNPDEGVEIIRVRWQGEKGSDPAFRDKADRWYNNAIDMLPREDRNDFAIRRKLHDQRDQIYKEMSNRWASGEKAWGPKQYVNMNKDMNQHRGTQFRETNQNYRTRTETNDMIENNSQKNF